MAYAKVKTEMKGDRARWTTREDAKVSSKRRRRAERAKNSYVRPVQVYPDLEAAPMDEGSEHEAWDGLTGHELNLLADIEDEQERYEDELGEHEMNELARDNEFGEFDDGE